MGTLIDASERFAARRLAGTADAMPEGSPHPVSLEVLDQRTLEVVRSQGLLQEAHYAEDVALFDRHVIRDHVCRLARRGESAVALHALNVLREELKPGTDRAHVFSGLVEDVREIADHPIRSGVSPDMAVSTLCTLYQEAYERELVEAGTQAAPGS
jgi:hypothetical protein